jgi:hypothetical protein
MSVCVYSAFLLSCVGSGPATRLIPVQGVLPTVYKIKKLKRKEFHKCPMLQREQQELIKNKQTSFMGTPKLHENVVQYFPPTESNRRLS